jgi:hypothetical protein
MRVTFGVAAVLIAVALVLVLALAMGTARTGSTAGDDRARGVE